ncbi:MAG: hypothetical protein QXU82_01300 [Candidatus Aenigmatarchaeota archaeon]
MSDSFPNRHKQLRIVGSPEDADICRVEGCKIMYLKREREEDFYSGAYAVPPKGARPKGERKIDDF